MCAGWTKIHLKTVDDALAAFHDLKGKRWLFRGQAKHRSLLPSIDRPPRQSLSRGDKLQLERRAIEILRSTVRFFGHPGEHGALTNDIVALMVLRHYGVPTRLLDWSSSPFVAAYFAACKHPNCEGEVWTFDEPEYERKGKEQWKRWPETTVDKSGNEYKFDARLTAFAENPPNWFICSFYDLGFPRQNVQAGAYSMTACFERDHACAIADLLKNESQCRRYIIESELKPPLLKMLHEEYGISQGTLFPDIAWAAEKAKELFECCEKGKHD